MFRISKTQHVLAVADFDGAVSYFTDKLGFTLEKTIAGWAFLHLDSFYLMVGDCKGEILARETRSHSWFAYVNCEGIDELYEQYRARGVQFGQRLTNTPWGMREFLVETPEGHRIKFGQEIKT